jgi:hypothetical protein
VECPELLCFAWWMEWGGGGGKKGVAGGRGDGGGGDQPTADGSALPTAISPNHLHTGDTESLNVCGE